jgi:hypothetical protein
VAFPTATVSVGVNESSSATGNRNITIPSCAAGDLLLAVVSSDGNPTFTGTLISNMTSLVAKAANGTAVTAQVLYRICTGSETSPWVLSLSASEACQVGMILIPAASWHGPTPPEAVAWVNVDTINPDPPTLNPAGWGTEDTLWIAVTTYDNGAVTLNAYPTNYADDQTSIRGNISSSGQGIATRSLNAASDDPGTFTLSASEDTLTTTIAVRPAAGVENHNGTAGLTGGGVLTRAAAKAAAGAVTLPGGGVLTRASTKAASRSQALTGGGILARSSSKGALRATGLAGGGTITAILTGAHAGAFTTTGGGVLVVAYDTEAGADASGTAVLTGGGVLTRAAAKGALRATALTAGARLTIAARPAHDTSTALTGAGVLALLQAGGRFGTVNLTGGGTILLTSEAPPVALTNLAAIMDAIAAAITDADITERAYAYPAESLSPPCVVVGYPDTIEFDLTYQRGADRAEIPVYFVLGRVTERTARDRLAEVIAGATGIKETLDGDLGGLCDSLRVTDMRVLNLKVGDLSYLAARFDAEVVH